MVIPKSNHKITQIFTRKQKINYRHRLTQINTNLSFKKKVNFTKEICFSFSTGFLFLKKKKCCVNQCKTVS